MTRRLRLFVIAGAALAAAGCANLGLNPFPGKALTPEDGKELGLDPFPEPMHPKGSSDIGLDPFPGRPLTPDDGKSLGLDPFPAPKPRKAPRAAPAPKPAPAAPAAAEVPAPAPAAPPPPPEPPPAPAAPPLRLKFSAGAVSHYTVNMDMSMKMPMLGDNPMAMKMGMDCRQEVSEVRAGGEAVVSSTFEAIRFGMANPMFGELSFDSADPGSVEEAKGNPIGAQVAGPVLGMVGRSVRMVQEPSGKVLEVAGLEALTEGMSGGMGMEPSTFTGLTAPFSDEPVREGLEWPFRTEAQSPMGTLTSEGTMRVTSWNAATGKAVISSKAKVTHRPPEKPAAEGDMQAQMMAMMKITDASTEGELVFDVGRGMVLSNSVSSRMKMENPMMGGEMSVEVKGGMKLVE